MPSSALHSIYTIPLHDALPIWLAPIGNAPNGVIRTLARHDEISVAGPVLAQSPQLTDGELVEIAGFKGQGHLGAISERKRVAAARSEEHTSELQSPVHLVCRLPHSTASTLYPYTTLFRSGSRQSAMHPTGSFARWRVMTKSALPVRSLRNHRN